MTEQQTKVKYLQEHLKMLVELYYNARSINNAEDFMSRIIEVHNELLSNTRSL